MKVGLEHSGAEEHGIFEQSLHAERGTASGDHAFFFYALRGSYYAIYRFYCIAMDILSILASSNSERNYTKQKS
jgi:hypothetical protein